MYIHAYDNDLNYLGVKEVEQASIEAQQEFKKELLLKYPGATINIDVEPSDEELYDTEKTDDLPF